MSLSAVDSPRYSQHTPLLSDESTIEDDFAEMQRLPICLRGPNRTQRWVVLNVASLGLMAAGTMFKIVNDIKWQNSLGSLLSSVAIGGSIETLVKIDVPPHLEKYSDEINMCFTACFIALWIQVELQFNHPNPWVKEVLLSAIAIQCTTAIVGSLTNLFSAPPSAFGTQEREDVFRPLLIWDTRKFTSLLWTELPLLSAGIALTVLGIVCREQLMNNVGNFWMASAISTMATQPVLEAIQSLRQYLLSQFNGDVEPPTGILEIVCGMYKVIPFSSSFLIGSLAAWNNWGAFLLMGGISGISGMITADSEQHSVLPPERTLRHHSLTHLLADALTPYPSHLLHSRERALLSTGRKVVDLVKGTLALIALVSWNAYMIFTFTNVANVNPTIKHHASAQSYQDLRVQVLFAMWSANMAFFMTSAISAFCKKGDHPLKNSLNLFIKNNPNMVVPLFLAFLDVFLKGRGGLFSAIGMWSLMGGSLAANVVWNCKNGEQPIIVQDALAIAYEAYIGWQIAQGRLLDGN